MSEDTKIEEIELSQGEYRAPHLTDYGPISELTKAEMGRFGDDGSYPSFTAS